MANIKANLLNFAVISTIIIGFLGCGGSSSSSDITFPSNATKAEATLENGQKVEAAVAKNQMNGVPVLNSINDTAHVNLTQLNNSLSQHIIKYAKKTNLQPYALNANFSDTISCSQGGTIHMNGTENKSSGSITMTAKQCQENNQMINGSMYMSVSNLDSTYNAFKNYNVKFTSDYTVSEVGQATVTISKNSYMNIDILSFDIYGDPKSFKLTTSLQVTDGTNSSGIQDCIFYYNSTYDSIRMYQTQGKVYINNLASYVSYDTSYDMSKTPFVINNKGELTSGEAHFIMAENAKVKISVVNNDAITYVDSNNDGIYELHE